MEGQERDKGLRNSLVGQMVKNPPVMLETWFDPWARKMPWRREWLPTPVFWPREFHVQRSLSGYSSWDGWMASPAWWTSVWVSSWSWWWTGRPVVLQSMGSQSVGHIWATELKAVVTFLFFLRYPSCHNTNYPSLPTDFEYYYCHIRFPYMPRSVCGFLLAFP